MNEINEENLSTAITVGSAICKELGLCCEKRGRVIFQIYDKLEELKSAKPIAAEVAGILDSSPVKKAEPKDF